MKEVYLESLFLLSATARQRGFIHSCFPCSNLLYAQIMHAGTAVQRPLLPAGHASQCQRDEAAGGADVLC